MEKKKKKNESENKDREKGDDNDYELRIMSVRERPITRLLVVSTRPPPLGSPRNVQ